MATNDSASAADHTNIFDHATFDSASEVVVNNDVARQSMSHDDIAVSQEQLQVMFSRFLSGWASDVLNLRQSGGDRFIWQRAA